MTDLARRESEFLLYVAPDGAVTSLEAKYRASCGAPSYGPEVASV
jgi:hypothetical protein